MFIINHVFNCRFITILMLLLILVMAIMVLLYGLQKILIRKKEAMSKRNGNVVHVGFFHPYCNACGGGERVLWCAIRALQV